MANYFCTDSVEEQVDYLTDKVKDLKTTKLDKAAIVQEVGTGTDAVMSQKAVTEQVQLLKQADVTINENLQTINTEVNGKLTKPTNPSAQSAVTMLADGTVGTIPLSAIGGGGKLYRHRLEFTDTIGRLFYGYLYKSDNTPYTLDTVPDYTPIAAAYGPYHGVGEFASKKLNVFVTNNSGVEILYEQAIDALWDTATEV